MKKFALMGAAGYIAPRHMAAMKDSGNDLIAAFDPNDSVGAMDGFFPDADFFTEFERFDRYVDKLSRNRNKGHVEYISICSPNYLHDSHIRFALRSGADAICEKPLVLNPWNIEGLKNIERDTGKKVNTILQLRLHPSIIALKEKVSSSDKSKKYEIDLTYVTSRGKWYLQSWKGDDKKSGGIATNIGVHFFDMLHYVFGELQDSILNHRSETKSAGYLEYENARVRWFLSIDYNDVPAEAREVGKRTYRSITCDGEEIEFSDGFVDLHTQSYKHILLGNGFGLDDNMSSVSTVSKIRNATPKGKVNDFHPFLMSVKD